jgi:hypothetical protein
MVARSRQDHSSLNNPDMRPHPYSRPSGSRSSFPYSVPQRLHGRLEPPTHTPSYLHPHPRAWPYAEACKAASRDLQFFNRKRNQLSAGPSSQSLPPQQTSPTGLPYKYRASLTQSQLDKLLTWLPTPSDPSHPYWDQRFYNCFAYGHRVDQCKGKVVCRLCLL